MDPGPDWTFARFIPTVASSDTVAHGAAFAAAPPDGPRLLFLHGPAGIGKTHLLRAIVDVVRARQPAVSIVRVNGRELAVGLSLGRQTVASIAARCHGDVRRGIGALTRLRFQHSR
jgi:chromosomal replication initiation ATPase DnaA